MKLPPFGVSTATFDPTGRYRYTLTRRWDMAERMIAFCMLNPSTADAELLDPTVRRCVGYALRWGYGGLVVLNIFALRSTDPHALYHVADPVGPANDGEIRDTAHALGDVICAWGVHGEYQERGAAVKEMLWALPGVVIYHLGLTKEGHPRHPLYLRGDREPEVWG